MTPPPRLLIFAKTPVPGLVKTRLVPPLTASQAAGLAEAFLLDALRTAAGLGGIDAELAYSPPESGPDITHWADRRWARGAAGLGPRPTLRPQEGANLGQRMCAALAAALAAGVRRAVVIGTDSPDLPAALLRAAFAALETADAVLGPCPDGGYYVLGTSRVPPPGLLDGIAWSSGHEAAATRDRLAGAGFRLAELPPWPDVDTPDDFRALARRLSANPAAAPHTRAFLVAERLLPAN